MKSSFSTFVVCFLFSLTAVGQYRCIPSLDKHGNPDGCETYETDLQNYYFNFSGTPVTTVSWQPVTSIGFPFYFNGVLVTHFKTTNNGILTFDTAATIIPQNGNAVLPDVHIPDRSVCIKGGLPAVGYTRIFTDNGTPGPNRQRWITFNCLVDSHATSAQAWSIVLEQNTNNIYIVNQYSYGSMPLTLGIQLNSSIAYMAPGSPFIQGKAGGSQYCTDNYYYAFTPQAALVSDGSITATSLPSYLAINRGPYVVKARFRNLGSDTLTALQMHYKFNGTTITQNFSNLHTPPGYSHWFEFTAPITPVNAGAYQLDIWADNLSTGNDLDTTNDHFTQPAIVEPALPQRRVMYEEFKGSWCPSSGYWTTKFDALLRNNRNVATNMHYEETYVNWNYDGDQICERESGFYHGTYIPISMANGAIIDAPDTGSQAGAFAGCPWNLSQPLIDSLAGLPGLFFIRPQLSIVHDSVATITATVTAATTLAAGNNCRVLVSLVEDTITSPTYFAPGNSHETILFNTCRIVLPRNNGINIHNPTLPRDTGIFIGHPAMGHVDSFNFSYTISDTSCHPSRLHVTVFVQDTLTHEIYQSAESDIPYTNGLQPRAQFTTNNSRICAGSQVATQNTSLVATSYKWFFAGAVPDTSTAQNPLANYPVPGLFDITLIAFNQYGSDTFTRSQQVLVMDTAVPLLSQNFESNYSLPANWWCRPGTDGSPSWYSDTTVSAYQHGSRCIKSYWDQSSFAPLQQSTLILPQINLSGSAHPHIKYDYACVNWTAWPGNLSDTLRLLISTDCGASYQTIYTAGRDSLKGPSTPNFTPDSSSWKTRSIDLTAYAGMDNVQIAFQYNSYQTANTILWLDNIQVGQAATANFAASAIKVCAGSSVNFQNTSIGSNSVLWQFIGGVPDTSSAQSPQITYASAGSWPVNLIAVNAIGNDTLNHTAYITVTSNPVVTISAAHGAICAGDSEILSAHGAVNYQWTSPVGLSSTVIADPTAAPATSTRYYVTGSDSNQCINTDSFNLVVNQAQVSSIISDTAVCTGASLTLDAGAGFSNYIWSTGANTRSVTISTAGDYYLTTTDANGCKHSNAINVQSEVCLGLNSIYNNEGIELYPNPANSFVTVKIPANAIGGLLSIYDATGKLISTQQIKQIQFNLSVLDIGPGIYFVQLTDNDGLRTVKRLVID